MIEFQSVTKEYDDGTRAVDDLSLVADTGAITVFVGPSGCGKTTSLRMINRMVDPTSGTVSIDGRDITTQDSAVLRRGIGYVIQQAGLFPHRSVIDNIATVPMLSGWTRRRARQRAGQLLETVGLPTELGKRFPAQLSGGQQQRVGVARALAADPPILLMDEPFSAVDPVVRADLQEELLRLQGELDKTIAFVTHDIDEAVKLGDKVAVFRAGGRLAQQDRPGRILRHPADDFVSEFVGKDRGFRGLSFVDPQGLTASDVPVVRVGSPGLSPAQEWILAVNDERRPRGWLAPGTEISGVLTEERLVAGGSLYTQGDPLRGALDAALSSPASLGVVVDEAGAVLGVLTPTQVLESIEKNGGV